MHLDATIGGARERLDDRPICQHVTQAHGVGRLPYVGNYILEVLAELELEPFPLEFRAPGQLHGPIAADLLRSRPRVCFRTDPAPVSH